MSLYLLDLEDDFDYELEELKFGSKLKSAAKKVGTHLKNNKEKYIAAGAAAYKAYNKSKLEEEDLDIMMLNDISAEELNELKFGSKLKKAAKKEIDDIVDYNNTNEQGLKKR